MPIVRHSTHLLVRARTDMLTNEPSHRTILCPIPRLRSTHTWSRGGLLDRCSTSYLTSGQYVSRPHFVHPIFEKWCRPVVKLYILTLLLQPPRRASRPTLTQLSSCQPYTMLLRHSIAMPGSESVTQAATSSALSGPHCWPRLGCGA